MTKDNFDLDATRFIAGQLFGLSMISETWDYPVNVRKVIACAREFPAPVNTLNNVVVKHLIQNVPDLLSDVPEFVSAGYQSDIELDFGDALLVATQHLGFGHDNIRAMFCDFVFCTMLGPVTATRGEQREASHSWGEGGRFADECEHAMHIITHAGGVAGIPHQAIWNIVDGALLECLGLYNHESSAPGQEYDIEAALSEIMLGLAGNAEDDIDLILRTTRLGAQVVDIKEWRKGKREPGE